MVSQVGDTFSPGPVMSTKMMPPPHLQVHTCKDVFRILYFVRLVRTR